MLGKCLLCTLLPFCVLGGKAEEPTYVTVTVDTEHKVSDHYDVGKKLGVYVGFVIWFLHNCALLYKKNSFDIG